MDKSVFRRLFWFLSLLCIAVTNPSFGLYLNLDGHLSEQLLSKSYEQVRSADSDIAIRVDSGSGDLNAVLKLAKLLYKAREEEKLDLVVYVDEKALGPAALIPYLANRLYVSPFASWGDISLDQRDTVPSNILRSQVAGLIPSQHPLRLLLQTLASAMSDPTPPVLSDEQRQLLPKELLSELDRMKSEKTPLVINQSQILAWKIIPALTSEGQWKTQFAKNLDSAVTVIPEQASNPLEVTYQSLEGRFEKFIPKEIPPNATIGYITIDDRKSGINESTWIYVKSALEHYKKTQPQLIILRLNTPGGEVFASQKISDALKEFDTQENIPVVAFIDNWAISAGAMLAYSCRFIAVVKDGSMGAAEPIVQGGQEGTKVASEKINSALRTDFANRAHFFDRNPLIAEAMVDKEIILVERHGEIVKLDTESQIRREGPYPDLLISAKDKLLTLDSEKLIHYGVADLLVPPTPLQSVSDRENEAGKWPASKEALFHYPPFDDLKGATIDSFQMDWRLSFLAILAHPAVASVLFLGLLMGAYMEMSTPGFGLPGGVALLCLFLIILSNFALEAVNVLELLFIAAGIALLLLEVFVLPGFGICGIAGILLLFVGILGVMLPEFSQLEYNPDTGNWNAAMDHFLERLSWLSGSFILAVILMILWGRGVARHPQLFSHLVLAGGEEESSKGYSAAGEGEDSLKVGDGGVVIAALRPTGKITVNDRTYTAVSQGEFIEEGIPVVVAAIEGAKISVTRSLQE